jgi:hypothetical protein
MRIEVDGGELIGAANGDPNCHEAFDGEKRSLFNGRAQAVIRPFAGMQYLTIRAECGKIKCNALTVELSSAESGLAAIESVEEICVSGWKVSAQLTDEKPDPAGVIASNDMNSFEPYTPQHGNGSKMAGAEGRYALFRARIYIPESLNGRLPTIHFNQLWGKGEVWVNGAKRLDFDCEWAESRDVPCAEDMTGDSEISVVVQCQNKYGAGVTSSVVIR